MRVKVGETPGYEKIKVTVNRSTLFGVLEADDEEGWVEQYKLDSMGKMVLKWGTFGEPETERVEGLKGKLKIIMPK